VNNVRLRKAVRQAVAVIVGGVIFVALPLNHEAGTSLLSSTTLAQAAEQPWEQEFNEVCAKTTDSMSLSREELKSLIARCEKLKPVIEGLEETTRKVYRKRLEMCKNLFVFMLESNK